MRYPGSIWYPSPVPHSQRSSTRGIVIHWTAGHEAGDLGALTGGHVDCHFYITKTGKVYQILDSGSEAWHAYSTANNYCLGIEHEGSGEPWTQAQFAASVKLSRWLCDLYHIPVRHTDPVSSADAPAWHGLYGHGDLAHIDGNNHSDNVPPATGWPKYIAAIKGADTSGLIRPPFYAWVKWRLQGANPKTRPKNWTVGVPSTYWTRLKAFLAARR